MNKPTITIYNDDCLNILRDMPDNSVDSVVTDPPYGINFMGKKWDYDVPDVEIWQECLRVLKPGGHLLAFAGTRTQHRMAVRIEDAGFEIRDMIAWVYGSGFPKSLDVSKAIDKAAGAEREVIGDKMRPDGKTVLSARSAIDPAGEGWDRPWRHDPARTEAQGKLTAPATDAARQWQGWGTALKPALEPITVARKPLIGTVAANVLAHGTGALNIDGCRVETTDDCARKPALVDDTAAGFGKGLKMGGCGHDEGRWPANLILSDDPEVVAGFPQAKGQQGALTGSEPSSKTANTFGEFAGRASSEPRGDNGSAARFFMQCKGDYNDAWQDLNLPQENANTAEQSSSQQRQAAVSALVLAVSSALPEGLLCSGLSMAPFTSATGGELKRIADSVTQTIQSIDSRFWHESKPARLTLSLNHASDAEIQRRTDTTTITVNRWKSDGSAEPVTFSITPMSLEVGGKDCAPSMDGKRFIYCAKASKKDRDEGLESFIAAKTNDGRAVDADNAYQRGATLRQNTHPTVKPTDLMAYLCRLVTPPGGVVLDPFMGSGSTGKAALREGFHFVGIEREAEYLRIAQARISAQVAATSAQQIPPPQEDLFSGILRA